MGGSGEAWGRDSRWEESGSRLHGNCAPPTPDRARADTGPGELTPRPARRVPGALEPRFPIFRKFMRLPQG